MLSLQKQNRKWFSITELIVVVSILSIISSLSIPNINKWVKLSRIDAAKAITSTTAAGMSSKFKDWSRFIRYYSRYNNDI